MADVVVLEHPLAAADLAIVRDRHTGLERFRHAATRLGAHLALQATRELPTEAGRVTTPLADAGARHPAHPVVAVAVLRAGLGLLAGVQQIVGDVTVGMVGLSRDPETLEPSRYLERLPELRDCWVLVLEPMLATGGSASAALAALPSGAARVTVLSVVATPTAVEHLRSEHPGVALVTAAVDPELDDNGYIVPGLGDFGDRLLDTPH